MRLINVATGKLEDWEPAGAPAYAILSHTWGDNEPKLEDMACYPAHDTRNKYCKIRETIKQATLRNIHYVWIDTCCIDKRSSAELSEAINSMFQWYKNAAVCFTYLEDLKPDADIDLGLETCRWTTRGWTLQELIAPKDVQFLDRDWNNRGTKESLQETISRVTGIRRDILLGTAALGGISAAEKMSWAASRKTTREEDMAYSLLGIFEVNMALIYGEGPKAFTRLQEEIIRHTNDLSIFAWNASQRTSGGIIDPYLCGVLAESPRVFANRDLVRELSTHLAASRTFVPEFSMTNRGLRITTELRVSKNIDVEARLPRGYFLCLANFHRPPGIGIYLKKVGQSSFVRLAQAPLIGHLDNDNLDWNESMSPQTIYIAASCQASPAPSGSLGSKMGRYYHYPPIHFPVHPYLQIETVFPKSSWDIFNRIFHTGMTGVSGFVGGVCCRVLSDTGSKGRPIGRVGIFVRTVDMKCRVFKWGSEMSEKEITGGDVAGAFQQARLVSFYSDLPAVKSVCWDSGTTGTGRSRRYQVRVSLQSEVVVAISTEQPVCSVHVEVSSKRL
ncbi:heterokaryon incompatibility protein-domain-containing protein [Rhypophila decipiens]|uniref:Heterokaryon incompatibility protein-domain-containing protein n=1 Tax=Rhypophila decipiens TaxID=261697 RepID=A0AAN6Y7V9_9PEZI|nr:heterokaryon incompatibility protein-domain-containing protein [Rhypophila decipiens]